MCTLLHSKILSFWFHFFTCTIHLHLRIFELGKKKAWRKVRNYWLIGDTKINSSSWFVNEMKKETMINRKTVNTTKKKHTVKFPIFQFIDLEKEKQFSLQKY